MHDIRYECLRIRRVEQAIANEYSKLEMRQPVHLDIGAEWASVAVCSQLEQHDKVFGGHRSHSQFLACGGKDSLKELIAGLMGKNDLSSMHLSSDGMFVASGSIVGGTIGVAVGAAWAKRLKGEQGIVVCFLGDGATEEGIWAESLSFSVLHELPILFVVQNNGLAVTTPIEDRHKYDIMSVARAYGLSTTKEPFTNLDESVETMRRVIARVHSNKPYVVEFLVERERVHCGVECSHGHELIKDCLAGYTTDESLIHDGIAEAFKFARQLPIPTSPERGVYA